MAQRLTELMTRFFRRLRGPGGVAEAPAPASQRASEPDPPAVPPRPAGPAPTASPGKLTLPVRSLKVDAVVFDLDDTLYPERQYVLSGYRAAGDWLRRSLGTEEHYEDWLWSRFLSGESRDAFNAISVRYGLDLNEEQIQQIVTVFRHHKPMIEPYPGIDELLIRLGEHAKLGLLSDGYLPAQQHKLDALGLGDRFDAVLFTESLGRDAWKPSPAGFEKLTGEFGVEPRRCAYVGDNPAKDFVAPNALGWRTIHYIRPGQIHGEKPAPEGGKAQTIVRTLDELVAALSR